MEQFFSNLGPTQMVLFQKFVRRFGPSTKMAPTTELGLTYDPMGNSHKNLLLRNHWANCNQTTLTQGSFQQSLVEIGSVVSEKIFFKFHPPFFYFSLGDHLGWKSGSLETNLEGGHPRTIPPKFGCNIGPYGNFP
jgi:hypothetical protein